MKTIRVGLIGSQFISSIHCEALRTVPGVEVVAVTSATEAHAKAFGKLCSKESKKHVAGGTATPFSQCVAAMKKAASGKASSPGQACKGMSKKHVAGMKGTPFSQCVVAAAHLMGNNGGIGTPAHHTTG